MAGYMERMRSAHKCENYYQLLSTSFVGQTDYTTVTL